MLKWTALFFFVGLSLIMPASLFAERMTDNWHLTGYTKYRDAVFADAARLSSPAPGITAIWIKIAPSKRSQYLGLINECLRTAHKETKRFRSIEILCEIDCAKHLIRFSRFVYLDNDRNTIHEAYEARPAQYLINEGSIWYPVEKEACLKRN